MTKGVQILLADDDQEDRFIMAEGFRELGLADVINFVEDGTQVLDYLDNKGAEGINLIILDLNMPRLNGTETLRVLKNNPMYLHIPVVILSTSVNDMEKKSCLELGAKDYLIKPVKYNVFLNTCRTLYDISQE
ncbi:MAG: response regulator [Flavipsychrobacter sp.]